MKKTVLIAGAGGFLGSALTRYLDRESSWKVVGLYRRQRKGFPKGVVCDLKAARKLKAVFADLRPDIIFNLTGGRITDSHRLYIDNIEATQSLFEAAGAVSGYNPRIIIPGTAAEYGRVTPPGKAVNENDPARPLSHYGFVKLMQTQLSLFYAGRGMDVCVARMFNICGFGTPEHLALGRFAAQVVRIENKRQPPQLLTGPLNGRRDFLDIDDVCRALVMIAKKGKSGRVYNVCSSRACTIRDALNRMLASARVRGITVREQKNCGQESFDIRGSFARLKKDTGWAPRVPLDKSLAGTLAYYRR